MSAGTRLETERQLRAAFEDAAARITADTGIGQALREPAPVVAPRAGRRVFVAALAAVLVVGVTLGSIALVRSGDGTSTPAAPVKGPRYDVTVFMNVDATPAQIDGVRAYLKASSAVRSFFFMNKDQELMEFKTIFRYDRNLVDNITAAALPTSFRVTLRSCGDVTTFAAATSVLEGVDSLTPPVRRNRARGPSNATPLTPARCRAGRRTR